MNVFCRSDVHVAVNYHLRSSPATSFFVGPEYRSAASALCAVHEVIHVLYARRRRDGSPSPRCTGRQLRVHRQPRARAPALAAARAHRQPVTLQLATAVTTATGDVSRGAAATHWQPVKTIEHVKTLGCYK